MRQVTLTSRSLQRCKPWLIAGVAALLGACAQPPLATNAAHQQWSGRLALKADTDPPTTLSAAFELQGNATQGQLTLFNPLGNAIARLQWLPEHALLIQGSNRRESPSLATLVQELTGSPLPIQALFAWLQGDPVQASGWQVDLEHLKDGRLLATRTSPPPPAQLRIVLQR